MIENLHKVQMGAGGPAATKSIYPKSRRLAAIFFDAKSHLGKIGSWRKMTA